jgi:hypothetical protein
MKRHGRSTDGRKVRARSLGAGAGHPPLLPDRPGLRQRLFGVVLTPSVSEDERVAALMADIGCA